MRKSVELEALTLLHKIRHPAISKFDLTLADKKAVSFILDKNGLSAAADYVDSLSLGDFEKWLKLAKYTR
jgi:hypothetical protein